MVERSLALAILLVLALLMILIPQRYLRQGRDRKAKDVEGWKDREQQKHLEDGWLDEHGRLV